MRKCGDCHRILYDRGMKLRHVCVLISGCAWGATYSKDVAPILNRHCVECHRTGGVAPFPLETYDQVMAKTGMIRKMVSRGLMPPWFAAAPTSGQHSPWLNDRSLSEHERADLLGWLDAGKPAGDPKDAPLARRWPEEWQIGEPDAVQQCRSA